MTFQESLSTCFAKYSDFTGRASRPEYWWFALFNFGVSLVVNRISLILGLVVALGLLVPGLAVGVRRLHDTNKSGWLLLIGLVPFVGWIILIVWFATDGDANANQYGERPAA